MKYVTCDTYELRDWDGETDQLVELIDTTTGERHLFETRHCAGWLRTLDRGWTVTLGITDDMREL